VDPWRRPRGKHSTVNEHLPEHRVDLRQRSKQHWVEQARVMGHEVEELVLAIFGSDDVLMNCAASRPWCASCAVCRRTGRGRRPRGFALRELGVPRHQEHPRPGARPRAAGRGAGAGLVGGSRFARKPPSPSLPIRSRSMSTTDELVPVLKKLRLSGVLHTPTAHQGGRGRQSQPRGFSSACAATRSSGASPSSSSCGCAAPASRTPSAWRTSSGPSTRRSQEPHRRAGGLPLRREARERALGRAHRGGQEPHRQALGERACRPATRSATSRPTACCPACARRGPTRATTRSCCASPHPTCSWSMTWACGRWRATSDRPVRDIRARYERGAMILTSNRALEEWYPLFKDELMLRRHGSALAPRPRRGHGGALFRNPPQARKAS